MFNVLDMHACRKHREKRTGLILSKLLWPNIFRCVSMVLLVHQKKELIVRSVSRKKKKNKHGLSTVYLIVICIL